MGPRLRGDDEIRTGRGRNLIGSCPVYAVVPAEAGTHGPRPAVNSIAAGPQTRHGSPPSRGRRDSNRTGQEPDRFLSRLRRRSRGGGNPWTAACGQPYRRRPANSAWVPAFAGTTRFEQDGAGT